MSSGSQTVSFTVPTDESGRYGALAVLGLMRQIADGIIGLRIGTDTIDDIRDDLYSHLRELANKDGELSESATAAATKLSRLLTQVINDNR